MVDSSHRLCIEFQQECNSPCAQGSIVSPVHWRVSPGRGPKLARGGDHLLPLPGDHPHVPHARALFDLVFYPERVNSRCWGADINIFFYNGNVHALRSPVNVLSMRSLDTGVYSLVILFKGKHANE